MNYTDRIKLVKEKEYEEMRNCQNEVSSEDNWTLLHHELKQCLKGQFLGSGRHTRFSTRTKINRIIKIIAIIAITLFITAHAICFSRNWSKTPSEMKWEEFCQGKDNQSEACVKLSQSVTKTDNSN